MWLVLALVAAGSTALRDVAAKQAVRTTSPVAVACGIALVPAIVLGTLAVATGRTETGSGFGLALLVSGGINVLATPLIVWALHRSDLSLVAPLTSLTPVFMLATAAVVLGERPTATGALGVVVIVAGAYLLNVSRRDEALLAPFRALLQDPGARAMLLVAFLYAISSTYDKVGVQASSPAWWAASVQAVVAVVLAPAALWVRRSSVRASEDSRPGAADDGGTLRRSTGSGGAPRWIGAVAPATAVAVAGLVLSVGALAQNVALTHAFAAYVIAVKRTSTLFGVLLGRLLFRERRTRERLLGALVMLVGFALLTIG